MNLNQHSGCTRTQISLLELLTWCINVGCYDSPLWLYNIFVGVALERTKRRNNRNKKKKKTEQLQQEKVLRRQHLVVSALDAVNDVFQFV